MKLLMYILVVIASAFCSLTVFSEAAECERVPHRYETSADNSYDVGSSICSFALTANSSAQHFSATAKRMLSQIVNKIRHACATHARMAIDGARRNAMVYADVYGTTYRPGRVAAATRLTVVIRHLII
ncbi:MAG: hypothetical protein ACI31D_01680 [Candidatus Limisoma sp.]